MTAPDDGIPRAIRDLERMLGIALMVQDVDPGPPASIVAIGMVDGLSNELTGHGPTEADAWHDLAVNMAAWRNVDPRQIRMLFFGA